MGLFRPLLSSFLNVSALPPSPRSFLARHIINTGHHFNAGPRLGAYSFRFSCIPDKTQAVSKLKKKRKIPSWSPPSSGALYVGVSFLRHRTRHTDADVSVT